jgi:hypothetical protein
MAHGPFAHGSFAHRASEEKKAGQKFFALSLKRKKYAPPPYLEE